MAPSDKLQGQVGIFVACFRLTALQISSRRYQTSINPNIFWRFSVLVSSAILLRISSVLMRFLQPFRKDYRSVIILPGFHCLEVSVAKHQNQLDIFSPVMLSALAAARVSCLIGVFSRTLICTKVAETRSGSTLSDSTRWPYLNAIVFHCRTHLQATH